MEILLAFYEIKSEAEFAELISWIIVLDMMYGTEIGEILIMSWFEF